MKKRISKLNLHRETLRWLEGGTAPQVADATSQKYCPYWECAVKPTSALCINETQCDCPPPTTSIMLNC